MPGAGRVFNKAIRREVAHVAKITSVDDALPEKPFRASLEHVIFVVSIPLLLLGFGLFSETAHFLSWFLSSVLYVCIGVLSFVAYFEIGANLRKALQHDYSESIASQRKNLALVGYYSYQGLSLGLTTIPLFYLLLVTGMVQAADACILEPSKDSVCVTGFIGFEDPMAPFARLYQALLFTADTVARGALLHLLESYDIGISDGLLDRGPLINSLMFAERCIISLTVVTSVTHLLSFSGRKRTA